MEAKKYSKPSVFVSEHAVDKYLRFVKKKPRKYTENGIENDLNDPKQELLRIYNESVKIEIPESCKVLSLLNNDFKEANYYYSEANSILLVLNKNKDVIITCYNYDPEDSKKKLIKKARQTIRVEQAKSKYQRTLEIKKDKSKYNEDREFYRRERRWK